MGAETILTVGSTLLTTLATVSQHRATAKGADHQAQHARAQAAADEAEARRTARKDLSKRRAQIGAAGVTVEGSPIEILADTAAEHEIEARDIRNRGELTGYRHDLAADQARSSVGKALLSGADTIGKALLSSIPEPRLPPT